MIKHISLAIASLLVVMVLSISCGDQKLDTSSDQAFSKSLKLVYEAVPEDDREEFNKNYRAVVSEQHSIAKASGGSIAINGLTANDIKEQGQAIRKKKKLRKQKSKLPTLKQRW